MKTQSTPRLRSLVNIEPTDSCGVGMVVSINNHPQRKILDLALTALANVSHRGAVGADGLTGDGAGVMTTIPWKLAQSWLPGYTKPMDWFGIGMIFLPASEPATSIAQDMVEQKIRRMGLQVRGWRSVPVDKTQLGELAQKSCPEIRQVFISCSHDDRDKFERDLFLVRRSIELEPQQDGLEGLYVVSMSCRTLTYKSMVLSTHLNKFYLDLNHSDYETTSCIYHQRFSTNTEPSWQLCQPLRMLAHNGEINTIRGNRNWMTAREWSFWHPNWKREDSYLLQRLFSFVDSDSASLDNALEVLTRSGRSPMHAMAMLIPPAWENDPRVTPAQKAFFAFHQCFSEPWDGPACVCYSDGRIVASSLDRNGLRPARYQITSDQLLILGSEVGAECVDESTVVEKGQLGAGEMLGVDLETRRLLRDDEIKNGLASRAPFQQWMDENQKSFVTRDAIGIAKPSVDPNKLLQHQVAAGVTKEEVELGLRKMVESGSEPTFSMGVDTPLAALSAQPRMLSDYFKQRFAQVTNPPIDPIREKLVMSVTTGLGPERNLLAETPEQSRVVSLDNPILSPPALENLLNESPFQHQELDCTWLRTDGIDGLHRAIRELTQSAQLAVECQNSVIVLTDKNISAERIAVPMLLAIGAVHQGLCKTRQRMMTSLIAETSDVRDPHQLALLFGYGATAVSPYLAFESIAQLHQSRPDEHVPFEQYWQNYIQALTDGLSKIMSKMGISVLNSYQGAQVFEAIGVGSEVIDTCFKHSYSMIEGIDFEDIARDCIVRHDAAFKTDLDQLGLFDLGISKPKRAGEHHVINGKVTKSFHQFVREGRADEYLEFQEQVTSKNPVALRDLFEFTSKIKTLPIDQVEPIENIRQRFTTAAMSLGAISPEAHEAIAIAMNQIGGKSNSGEGGEEPRRFHVGPDGKTAISKIKQVASGRFGVDIEYLNHADEIEIKMAQGAKPGEGGQLPGFKVNSLIAKLRNTDEGVTLISPPPHHDIYSIEDLAQLIFDLKNANPLARVCVKLVAKTGVGGIAVGVAKSLADSILISGHEGGTGASPLTSIKHAGIPWEMGLSETHQSLVAANLRNRIVLRADGGLRTGKDIVHAAILGAEEFNFGTMALIALGCVYVKKCHLNNCPVGIATQDPKYRDKFQGKPENLIRYLDAVAGEVRGILASLGAQSIDEIVGQTDLLVPDYSNVLPKSRKLQLQPMLHKPETDFVSQPTVDKYSRPPKVVAAFDDKIKFDPSSIAGPQVFQFPIRNIDRNIGTRLAGKIAKRFGKNGLAPETFQLKLVGTAGQSLGAFLCEGISIDVTGEANDYVGKGMCGGQIVIKPHEFATFRSWENAIAGNTILYGATGGTLMAAGMVGQRFCVRNSGAVAVVEGCGDHGCEYMTRGTALILGQVGNNFGAGMTGGAAFVFDEALQLDRFVNSQSAQIQPPTTEDLTAIKSLIETYFEKTASARAAMVLNDWNVSSKLFLKVFPKVVLKGADASKNPSASETIVKRPAR